MTRLAPPRSATVAPGSDRSKVARFLDVGSHLAALTVFGILAIGMTWPLALDLRHRLVSWGDPVFQAWTIAWDVHAALTDPLIIFDANIFYPYANTLAYSDHLFGQAALVAPILLTGGNAILADNIAVLTALTLSGFAMYLLVVDLTGSRMAAILAGVAYMFAPARMAHLEHLHILSAQWLPLAVLAARRALTGNSLRWAGVTGLVVVLQGLFGIYYLYFLIVLLSVVVGCYAIWHRTPTMLTATAKLGVTCALAAALLVPTLLPYQRVHEDLGIERSVQEVTSWRARASDYLAVAPSNALYGDTLGAWYHRNLERDLFPGVLVLALALVGLFERRRGWVRWMLLILTAVSIILSLGLYWDIGRWRIPLPYQVLYEFLPGFRAIRVPARFGLLALVGLTALAGLGLALLLRIGRERTASHLMGLALALGLAAVATTITAAEDATRITLPGSLPTSLAEARRPDYQWMAENPAPAIEFPMGEGIVGSAWPNLWSTFHWNSVVNGYSGLTPPVYYVFRDRMRDFPSPETVRLLQGIGVRTIVYHLPAGTDPSTDPFLSRAESLPQLVPVIDGPDYVYQLRSDPWLWKLTAEIPDGEAVDLPALKADAATFGMLAAILQREGHSVYGNGSLDYWHLQPAPASTCYTILPAVTNPDHVGYSGAVPIRSLGGLTIYHASRCSAD
jgi:hypothetical protein